MGRLSVHHFVANLTTTRHGSSTTWNLLGVDYWFAHPAEIEFPRIVARLDLFTRFFVRRVKSARFVVFVRWLDAPRPADRQIHRSPVFRLTFPPGIEVADRVFRLANVRLPGLGRYVFRLCRRRKPRDGGGWEVLRTEYLCVELHP